MVELMRGRFPINEVDKFVIYISPGAYILSRDGRTAHYVGRSDSDVEDPTKRSATERYGYRYFWFEYASSPMKAYQLECEWYHKFSPSDNSTHPAVPRGANWRCSVSGCECREYRLFKLNRYQKFLKGMPIFCAKCYLGPSHL